MNRQALAAAAGKLKTSGTRTTTELACVLMKTQGEEEEVEFSIES